MKVGIYIHIPFCQSRCVYCGFYSTTNTNLSIRYIDAITKEMKIRSSIIHNASNPLYGCEIDTIYIGGGTPSTLTSDEIGKIVDCITNCFEGTPREITIEVNPDDVNVDFIRDLREIGINRVSIGIQSFNNDILKFAHRRHTAELAQKAIENIRSSGIHNISIDLMFGFPGETMEVWNNDIRKAINLNPEHISAYSLMYEENTWLFSMLQSGKIKPIDDDLSRDMYTLLIEELTKNGYEHYEISNFCKPGKRAIHNSSYWNDTPYIGIGPSAHSYDKKTRSWNISDLKKYMESIEKGVLPSEKEQIDADTHYNDLVTTAMRTKEGLDLTTLPHRYVKYAIDCSRESISAGLLELKDKHLRLTNDGLYVSDMIMSELIKV